MVREPLDRSYPKHASDEQPARSVRQRAGQSSLKTTVFNLGSKLLPSPFAIITQG
jgi:hypothetical protein